MIKKKVLHFCILLVIEWIIAIVIVNVVSKEQDFLDTLFLFGLGISILGALINPKIFKFLKPRHFSGAMSKMGRMLGEDEAPQKSMFLELNILAFGLLLIITDIIALNIDFVHRMISF